MSNKSHENNQTSPENQQDDNNDGNSVIGLDEGSMKLIVIVLGVLLFFGFVGVVGTIVYRVINLPQTEAELGENISENRFEVVEMPTNVAIGHIEVEKPLASKLKTFQVSQGLVYLHFENTAGVESIRIVRLSDGMVMGGIGFVRQE